MASQPPKSQPPPPLTSSPYPYAAAPDIIRAHQKDAYFQGLLTNQISDLHRRLRGARSAHSWATETRTIGDALYLCLTTLIGNRTLGEEYCDLVQVEAPPSPPSQQQATTYPDSHIPPKPTSQPGPLLPSLSRRAGFIATSTLTPYLFTLLLPKLRSSLRRLLTTRLTTLTTRGLDTTKQGQPTSEARALRYILTHLSSLTNPAHIHAITLATFYFTGAYYSLSKRLFGLRYIFTKRIPDTPGASQNSGRGGYEVLGVLLVTQMLVRTYLHLSQQLSSSPSSNIDDIPTSSDRYIPSGPVEVSLDDNAYALNTSLLDTSAPAPQNQRSLAEIARTTHTPLVKGGTKPRYDLSDGKQMAWIKGYNPRKCTLCLEELKDPAVTSCGHVFCWECIGDWVREKPECPLCRREAMGQKILPLRMVHVH
ncbi:peroxisome biogenesis factor 10 [Podospora pseudopauciseta]|uniref:RING-type E3 ubiquitin transferase n=2 Tax=Podospora TaxID=5144 RepID=A0ABR0HXF8_9PEZI|nr:peroxisome biogenesis factor 10 [Podospora pseudopauciseta]KAK4681066.1 peroxisome biogenesis factor 10 [Podospora pseudoanserina]